MRVARKTLAALVVVGILLSFSAHFCFAASDPNPVLKRFYVTGMERYFMGGLQARCQLEGGQLFVPDTQARNQAAVNQGVQDGVFGIRYTFSRLEDRLNGTWHRVSHDNIDLQQATGTIIGTGGFMAPDVFVPNGDEWSGFPAGGYIRRISFPTSFVQVNGLWFLLYLLVGNAAQWGGFDGPPAFVLYVICEMGDQYVVQNEWGIEAVLPPLEVGCLSGNLTIFSRMCQARNKRLMQPTSGKKDLVIATQILRAVDALPSSQQDSALNAMYLLGASFNSLTGSWHFHDENELPNGVAFSHGRCRPDNYSFTETQPEGVYSGWARNFVTYMAEPFCFDDESNTRVAFTFAYDNVDFIRGGGWRARSLQTGCDGTQMYVACEDLPESVSIPDTGLVVLNHTYGLGAGALMPLCSLYDPNLQTAVMNSIAKQVELERKTMSTILESDNSTAVSQTSVLLGAQYISTNFHYPFTADDTDGEWVWYSGGTTMQSAFNNPAGTVGYVQWYDGYPEATGGVNSYVAKTLLAYNMNVGGWINVAEDDTSAWIVCEKAPTPQTLTSSILFEPTPANVASTALHQLCITRGLAPVAIDTAAKQTELIVKTVEMLKETSPTLQVTDQILLNGRYTSDVYPPDLQGGHWVHTATGAPFMTGHSLMSSTITATAYQSWVAGKQPATVTDSTSSQEAGLTLAFLPSSGGWVTTQANAAVASWVACVAGSGQKTETESLSENLLFPTETTAASISGAASLADRTCIERDPTSRGLAITSAAMQAALEFAMLKRLDATDSARITSDVIVLLAASYDAVNNEWYWTGSGDSFTTGFSLDDDAKADSTQYQNWAVGYPIKASGTNAVWFSLEKGGWVNIPPSDKQIIVCESGHEQYQDDAEKLFTVTAPTGVATLSQASDQASVLCEANSDPSGVPYPITRSEDLWRLEMGIVAKLSDGSLTAGDVALTNETLADAESKSLRVSWAAGYPDTSDPSATTFIAYDTTLMGFVNVKADAADFIVVCYQADVPRRNIVITDASLFASANIPSPQDDAHALANVCALSEPPGSPLVIQNAGAQHILQVVEMRDIFLGRLTPGEPILTSGRYSSVSDDWAWDNDQSRKFATGISGASFEGSYTNWPSGFTGTSGNIILANSAGMGVWTSVDGASTSYFVACQYPLDALYSFVAVSPAGLPAPDWPHSLNTALCRIHDPPGDPLIASDEETQRGLGRAVRRAVVLGEITSTTDVLLTRATVGAGGSVSWNDGTSLTIDSTSHIQWASGYPQSGATLTMLAFKPTLAGWVNVAPTAAGTPYSLACQTCGADNTECFQRIGVFFVPVVASGSSSRTALTRSAGVPDAISDGWAACAAYDGAPVQVLNASVDVEVQTLTLRHYMNSSDTLLQQRSTTPVLLGAYKDNATNQWGWVDPLQLTVKLTPATYTNWVSEPAEGDNYASFVLSDGQWVSHGSSEVPTVAACVPYDYTIYVSPPPPPVNPGDESSSDSTQPDWSDPFAVCALNGGVPLRVFNQNLQAALEANVSAAATDAPDVILLGGEFAGDTFSGAWQWMVQSSDSGHGPAFTQNYAVDSDPAAVPVDGAYAKWAPGYPKLINSSEIVPSATLLAYSKSAGGWINVNPADGPYRFMCTLSQGPDDGYVSNPNGGDDGGGSGFPWWIILIIVLAVLLLLLIVLIIVLCCCCRKKKEKDQNTHFEANEKPPEGPNTAIYYPPLDSDVPVANPLVPYRAADEDAPAKVRERRSRMKRGASRHAATEIADVNTDFMTQNTEVRDDGGESLFSPAGDTGSAHSVDLL